MTNSLSGGFQIVILSGQTSNWENIRAGLLQGSILGPLFFPTFFNDLTNILKSNVKLFLEICEQWKMVFSPDSTKQAQEVIFFRKSHSRKLPDLYFNIIVVEKVKTQKHLVLKLDKTLNFRKHLKDMFATVNKGIGMLKKLNNYLPRHSLLTLYKLFTGPHLDYADIIYGKPNNMNICNKIEGLQYNGALAIIGAARESSKEKLYQELRF